MSMLGGNGGWLEGEREIINNIDLLNGLKGSTKIQNR